MTGVAGLLVAWLTVVASFLGVWVVAREIALWRRYRRHDELTGRDWTRHVHDNVGRL